MANKIEWNKIWQKKNQVSLCISGSQLTSLFSSGYVPYVYVACLKFDGSHIFREMDMEEEILAEPEETATYLTSGK